MKRLKCFLYFYEDSLLSDIGFNRYMSNFLHFQKGLHNVYHAP